MKTILAGCVGLLLIVPTAVCAGPFSGLAGDKTLVAWVAPANLSQRGGSVLTIDEPRSHFDGIVFGELAPGRWMAGSELYRRTQQVQDDLPLETADGTTLVQIAIVYRDREVTIYRNGVPYANYETPQPQSFGKASAVLVGLRHIEAGDRACFIGAIDDARIYGLALTSEQIAALEPNRISDPKPLAWWNFNNGKAEDFMRSFPPGRLVGNARIELGRLILDGKESYMITPPESAQPPFSAAADVSDEWVLNYHLMHPGGASLPGDPNAAFHLGGVYHLHYILAHPWKGRQSFSFVHLTSPDMLHWTWHDTKLQPSFTGHGMFSGTGFVTKEGRPAIIYHGQASGLNQIAIASDNELSAWEKPYPVVVRNKDGSEAQIKHWDPDCFRIDDVYYAISGGAQQPLFKSKDLKNWTLVGDFLAHELPQVTIGEDISCPNFFPLGDKWMLLCISHPLGCRYYIGDWDAKAEQFVPQQHGRMNWRRDDQPLFGLFARTDFFAPESVLAADGRRVMLAWITTAGPDRRLLDKTIQSLPRQLSLTADGELRIKPLRELDSLRSDPAKSSDVRLSNPITGHGDRVPPVAAPYLQSIGMLPGDSAEIRITIAREEAERKLLGFTLFADGTGKGLPVVLRPETGVLRVGAVEAPFAVRDLRDGEDVVLRIFVDKYLVEVFANDRQAVLTAYLDNRDRRQLDAFTVGAATTLKSVEIWRLKPTNQGFRAAQKTRHWLPRTE